MPRSVRLLAAAVIACGLFAAAEAPAASTPFGTDHFGLYVTNLQNLKTAHGYADGSPEAEAIAKAVAHFADPSTTYAEDITDFQKGLAGLRKVFGTDFGQLQTNKELMAKFLTDRVVGIPLVMIGLGNAAYANDSLQTRFKVYTKISALSNVKNEATRLKKAAALMKSIQAHAKQRRVNLYVSP
jgi:hypothetical protein